MGACDFLFERTIKGFILWVTSSRVVLYFFFGISLSVELINLIFIVDMFSSIHKVRCYNPCSNLSHLTIELIKKNKAIYINLNNK
jgi:hypothetical protein